MSAPQTLTDRDAQLTVTTAGDFEVELFKGYENKDGELKWAHHFRDWTEDIAEAQGWISAWLNQ